MGGAAVGAASVSRDAAQARCNAVHLDRDASTSPDICVCTGVGMRACFKAMVHQVYAHFMPEMRGDG